MNNVRLKEVELNPVVNRDLTRRCRPMSSLANHNTIMKADIKNLMLLIKNFDEKYELYTGKQVLFVFIWQIGILTFSRIRSF